MFQIVKHKKAIIESTLIVFASVTFFFAVVAGTYASDISVDSVIALVNKARTAAHIASLQKNEMLQKAAEEKAEDMISKDYFAHFSPEGKSPWDFIINSNYDYQFAGENLAINFVNAEDEQKAWMNSPLHKKNILNPNYDEIGVAVRQGVVEGHETTVVVQMFGTQVKDALNTPIISEDPKVNEKSASWRSTGTEDYKLKFEDIMQNNRGTLMGWMIVFVIAIIVIMIDVAALVHKKHKPLFINHKA